MNAHLKFCSVNPLSANPTKLSNALIQLSVFDVGLVLKGLRNA